MFPRGALIFPFAATVATEDEGCMNASVAREFDVAVAVADHPALCEINVKICRRTDDKTGLRFTAIAIEAIGQLAHGRMMRAIVDCIKACAVMFKFQLENVVHSFD